jgi:drug/metabolite transporter (DMT)-like permease
MHGRVSKAKTFALVTVVVALNSFGNLALAWGMRHSNPVGAHPLAYLNAMLNPFVALGICLLILWMLTRMALLSWADLSFVLPVTGTGYVLAALFGKVFLHETVSGAHWIGVLLVFIGTGMVGSTKHKTVEPNE